MVERTWAGRTACVALLGLAGALGCSAGDESAADVPACEQLGFPCTIAGVDPDVLRSSLALGEDAVGRIRTAPPHEVAAWLRTQAGVVEVLESTGGVAFRLDGGRRVWLLTEHLDPARAAPDVTLMRPAAGAARRWLPSLPVLYAQSDSGPQRQGGVVGIDYDGDGKINQRDPKRALILVPDPHVYGDQALQIEDLLVRTPGYDFEGSVDLREGPSAGADAFRVWNDYDLVHVAAGSSTVCWAVGGGWINPGESPSEVSDDTCLLFLQTGTVVDPSTVDGRVPRWAGDRPNSAASTSEYQEWVNSYGLEIFAVLNEDQEPEWRLFATTRFFRDAYPSGVRRAFVFLNVSNQWALRSIGDVLAGSPAQSTVLMWRSFRQIEEADALAEVFYDRAVEGWAPSDILEAFLGNVECAGPAAPTCGFSGKVDIDLRIREVVEIRRTLDTGDDPLLEDGRKLETLMDDPLAVEPTIDFTVDVYGIMPADEQIPVRIELDGKPIAERVVSEAEQIDTHLLRFAFDDVPIDPAVQDGKEHELDAILSLPRGGESRYSARLATINRGCYWEVDVNGPVSGHFTGSGIRLRVGDEFSELQLDTGFNPMLKEHWSQVTGVTMALGAPPALGTLTGAFATVVSSDNGMPVSAANRWSVDITTLTRDQAGRTSTIGGTFEADFRGAVVDRRAVRQPMTARGRFLGTLSGPHGCGSELFLWFVNAVPVLGGSGS